MSRALLTFLRLLVLISVVAAVSACGGGGGGGGGSGTDDGTNENTNTNDSSGSTVTVGGSIEYLGEASGTVELRNTETGEMLSLSAGETSFQFDTAAEDGDAYAVEAVDYTMGEVSRGYACAVENATGEVGTSDISDIAVSCGRNIEMVALDGYVNSDGLITFLFQTVDGTTGAPIETRGEGEAQSAGSLSIDEFSLRERAENGDESELGSESYFSIIPRESLDFQLKTVLSIDVSSSITPASLADMKRAAVSLVSEDFIASDDSIDCSVESPTSALLPGQEIEIRTFGDDNNLEVAYTDDLVALCTAIDGIGLQGGTTTRLYDAIDNGLASWDNSFTLADITLGYLVIITDGQDETVGGDTEDQRIANLIDQRDGDNKSIYTIGVGTGVDEAVLREFGNGGFATLDNYGQVADELQAASENLAALSNSVSYLEYATGKRDGTYEAILSVENNVYQGLGYRLGGEYVARDYWGVAPTLIVDGGRNVTVSGELDLAAAVRFTQQEAAPTFTWTNSTAPSVATVETSGDGNSGADAAIAGVAAGTADFTVDTQTYDSGGTLQETVSVRVSDVSADVPDAVSSGGTVELTAESASADPAFSWRISGFSGDSCEFSNGLTTVTGATVSLVAFDGDGSCTVRVENTNGGSGYFEKQVTVGIPNATRITLRELGSEQPTSALTFTDFESGIPSGFGNDAVNPWQAVMDTSGDYVARSGNIGHNESSTLELYVEGNFSELRFDYRVSSEPGYDDFKLFINGFQVDDASGDTTWQSNSYDLTTRGTDDDGDGINEYRIQWVYEKDGSISEGEDAAYLDDVELIR